MTKFEIQKQSKKVKLKFKNSQQNTTVEMKTVKILTNNKILLHKKIKIRFSAAAHNNSTECSLLLLKKIVKC